MRELSGLRVCFLAGTLGQGGAERQLYYILQALKRCGAEPHLLSLTRGEFWEEPIRQLGVPVTWVGRSPSRLVRLATIAAALRAVRPHVVQSQHFYTNLYAAVAGRVARAPAIGAIRSDGYSEVRGNGRMFGKLHLRTPQLVAANSRPGGSAATSLGLPVSRVCLLPNSVDTDRFQPRGSTGRHGALTVVAVGRLAPVKRFDVLLEALALLRKDVPGFSASVVGEGPLRAALEAQAEALGLFPPQVTFAGGVWDTAPLYREADAMVLCSDWEGTPNVVLEAMASGLPVVATRVGGVPDVVQPGRTGILVEPGNAHAIADSLLTLARDPELRRTMGRWGREYVEMNHSLGTLPGRLAELYSRALGQEVSLSGFHG